MRRLFGPGHTQLPQLRPHLVGQFADFIGLAQEPRNGDSECAKQLVAVERTGEPVAERLEDFRRKVIEALAVVRRKVVTTACKAERIVADATRPVLGVPEPSIGFAEWAVFLGFLSRRRRLC